jgi:hypothetical protein
MKRNPHNHWTIEDVAFLCRNLGLQYRPPPPGSHCVISHPRIEGLLTIPAERPLKPIYVMLLAQLAEGMLEIE